MKTPSFWYAPPTLLSKALRPIGKAYALVGKIRRKYTSPYLAKVPIICVGNVTAGGAGKTPTCLALANILKAHQPVFVTRGYGGKESGPLRADLLKHKAYDIGDEALLLAQSAPCWIGKNRPLAIKEAEKEASHIIVDDGLQNPTFKPDISFLVIDGGAGLGNEQLIPAGPLREPFEEALTRIDAVILIGDDTHSLQKRINKPIFRAHLRPTLPPKAMNLPNVLAFAGIGRPNKFYNSCQEVGLNIIETRDFPDHHPFSYKELKDLKDTADRKKLHLITTAKDYVRLPELFRKHVSVLGVQLVFDTNDLATFLEERLPI